jgi:3-oxoacyl-[acyl-carrier protein] reductase
LWIVQSSAINKNRKTEKIVDKTSRIVVITGAAGGIGSSTARIFANNQEIVMIILVDHQTKEEQLQKLVVECRTDSTLCRYFINDVADPESVLNCANQMIYTFKRVDVLINMAGIASQIMSPLVKTNIEAAKRIVDINLFGTLRWCKAFLPHMQSRGYGRIVNIASISAFMADPGNLIYSASKAGVVSLTKGLAKEAPFNKNGQPHDITVNAVAPGIIDTDMAKQLSRKILEGYKQTTPFGRLGKPEEIAEVIFWLATKAPQFLTGEVIRVDGGFLA